MSAARIPVLLLALPGALFPGSGCSPERGRAAPVSGALPASWYAPPQTAGSASSLDDEPEAPPPGPATDAAVRSVFRANTSVLEGLEEPRLDKTLSPAPHPADWVPWHLDGMIADFTVATTGMLGILLSGGSYAIKGTWRRPVSAGGSRSARRRPALTVRQDATAADLEAELEPSVRAALASGLVRSGNEAALRSNLLGEGERFLSVCRSLDTMRLDSGWLVNGYELQISLNASGQVLPLLGVGGAFNLYFDWVKPPGGAGAPPGAGPPNRGLEEALQVISAGISNAVRDAPELRGTGLALQQLQVGLGFGGGEDFGIAQSQDGIVGKIIFMKDPAGSGGDRGGRRAADRFVSLIASADRKGLYRIRQSKLEKGLRKAIRIGSYFARRAIEAESERWKLSEIETEFDLNLGGDLMMTSLTGSGQIVLDFDRP